MLLQKHKNIVELQIPKLSDPTELFKLAPKEKVLQQGEIIINYKIPMVSTKVFRKMAIISIPTSDRKNVKINKYDELVTKITIDDENSTYGIVSEMTNFYEDIYEDSLRPITKCIKNLMMNNTTSCDILKLKNLQDEIFELGEEILIINEKTTPILCV